MAAQIVYANEKLFRSFHEALTVVARERIYLEMVEPPPIEKIFEFQGKLVETNAPVFYAVEGDRVIGFCDIFPMSNPRQAHRGSLGMGLIPGYRGKGLGTQLLQAALDHGPKCGLEKVELHVYTTNTAAIALYEKFGFEQEGVVKKYRKLDGQYFDCLSLAKFL